MQITAKTKRRNPKKDRPRARRKAAVENRKRSGSHGGTKSSSDAAPHEPLRLSVLAGQIKTLSGLDLSVAANDHADWGDVLAMIDTEEKQLQAISDLWLIVKAQPKYKKLKEPKWSVDTPPLQILQWLLRKLGPLAEGEEWTIDTWMEGRKQRYRFVVYRRYSGNHMAGGTFKRGFQFFPLDFLPFLKKKDEPLHDMIVDAVALMNKHNDVRLWDEDGGAFEQAYDEHMSNESVISNYIMDAQLKIYRHGVAAQYAALIRKRAKQTSATALRNAIVAYDDNSERKWYFKSWLKTAVDIIASKQTIGPSVYVPHYNTEECTTPKDLYRFIWSMHLVDIIYARAMGLLESTDTRFSPMSFTVTYPGKVFKPFVWSEFPTKISNLLYWGRNMVVGRYSDYYYNKAFNDGNTTPSEIYENARQSEIEGIVAKSNRNTLIRALEAHDIRNTRKK